MAFRTLGASADYARAIKTILDGVPPALVRAAQVNAWYVDDTPKAKQRYAHYEHGTRDVHILPGLEQPQLRLVVLHELAHAFDDILEVSHYFSESPYWVTVIKEQGRPVNEAVESFAQAMAEHLADPARMRRGNPQVATYMDLVLEFLRTHF